MNAPSRTLTTVAVGVLLLDAVLLGIAGVVLDRRSLVLWGAVCGVLAVLVAVAWRRYRRTLAEIEAARREMRHEVESIRELLQRERRDP